MLVANVQHVPPNAPPSPPNSIEEEREKQRAAAATADHHSAAGFAVHIEPDSSEDEGAAKSPLQRIAGEIDQIDEERRDMLGPLSPVSSKASASSRSSTGGYRHVRNDKPTGARPSDKYGYSSTIFSPVSSIRTGHDSLSIRSISSGASSPYRSSKLKHQLLRNPDTPTQIGPIDLFPVVKARLSEVQFRPSQYDPTYTSPDTLRQEMLSVVFGWNDDIESLIRDERKVHLPASHVHF